MLELFGFILTKDLEGHISFILSVAMAVGGLIWTFYTKVIRKPRLEFYPARWIQIGFHEEGPVVIIEGSMYARFGPSLIKSVKARVTYVYNLELNWLFEPIGSLRRRAITGSRARFEIDLFGPMIVKPEDPTQLRALCIHFDTAAETGRIMSRLDEWWNDWIRERATKADNAAYLASVGTQRRKSRAEILERYFPEFEATHVYRISRDSLLSKQSLIPGEYAIWLSIRTSTSVHPIEISGLFTLTAESCQALATRCDDILSEKCVPQDPTGYWPFETVECKWEPQPLRRPTFLRKWKVRIPWRPLAAKD
ncbi:MAG TPA: hypothetical protein VGM51_09485 [Armatimonadota bacterium]|jgi:hypothetical protein